MKYWTAEGVSHWFSMSSSHDGYLSDGEAISLMPVHSQSVPEVPLSSPDIPHYSCLAFSAQLSCFYCFSNSKYQRRPKTTTKNFCKHKTFLLRDFAFKGKIGKINFSPNRKPSPVITQYADPKLQT